MTDMTVPVVGRSRLEKTGDKAVISGAGYLLVIRNLDTGFTTSPYALLTDEHHTRWSALNLLSSVHRVGVPDETRRVKAVEVVEDGDDVLVVVTSHSSAWKRHIVRLRCTVSTVELSVEVTGRGRLTDFLVFGGVANLPGGACGTFRSSIDFGSVFVPSPTEPVQFVRPAGSAAALGVVGDARPGRLNGIFSPPPLALGFGREQPGGATEMPGGRWLGLSVRAEVSELTFTTLRYEPLDSGFLLRVEYDGHTTVDGTWQSPTFVLRPSATGWGILDDYRDDLVRHGLAPADGPAPERWWLEPMFCGWGAQCARVAHPAPDFDEDDGTDPDAVRELADDVGSRASDFATQEVYDEFLATLAASGLRPGTIVIDDRWQRDYGTATPDLTRWPDLRGWIAARHAEGQKVLLWWKAWDPGGLPLEECVLDAAGHPISADPANAAYRSRLGRIIHNLLSTDGVDADGVKVDFTQRAPSGQTLVAADGAWGISGLHLLLHTLYRAAKAAKPDALVITHAVHPSFGDTCDMVRLNDILKRDIRGQRVPAADQLIFRQKIAATTLPNHAIDTDQWPIQSRAGWLAYAELQPALGVPSLYYAERIDRSGETIRPDDLGRIAASWNAYRSSLP
jgi:hypothetical protein